ncbi:hypothetical protein [Novosphingobium sp. RL4]|uniref:hypothetical protein n=1 Tax=Novosphingobium sp. RL4 TaxID=3109595 RepID=UPI002D77001B|nr:hypothetical protein [Novosphingobium sp. RL4]WRT91791.1 hypothetical protein U9J33_11260 [Novosphingobium sp. RL4]
MPAFRKMLTLAAVSALAILPGVASAQQSACLTKVEARSLFGYALPQVISGTSKRCAQVLPSDSYLRNHGAELVARYTAQKSRYWPEAKIAFLKLGEGKDAQVGQFARNLPDESLRPLVDITVEGMVSQGLPLKSCDKVDLALDLLSPLPPENTAGLIALLIEVTSKADEVAPGKAKLGGFTLCKD